MSLSSKLQTLSSTTHAITVKIAFCNRFWPNLEIQINKNVLLSTWFLPLCVVGFVGFFLRFVYACVYAHVCIHVCVHTCVQGLTDNR